MSEGAKFDEVAAVTLDTPTGAVYAQVEQFKLDGADKPLPVLALQHAAGGAAVRHALDSAEVAALRKRYPDLDQHLGGGSAPSSAWQG